MWRNGKLEFKKERREGEERRKREKGKIQNKRGSQIVREKKKKLE